MSRLDAYMYPVCCDDTDLLPPHLTQFRTTCHTSQRTRVLTIDQLYSHRLHSQNNIHLVTMLRARYGIGLVQQVAAIQYVPTVAVAEVHYHGPCYWQGWAGFHEEWAEEFSWMDQV